MTHTAALHRIRRAAADRWEQLPSGWWVIPCAILGACGWALLLWAAT